MDDSASKKEEKIIVKVKNATDLQRLKLEKLMKNPVSSRASRAGSAFCFTTQLTGLQQIN